MKITVKCGIYQFKIVYHYRDLLNEGYVANVFKCKIWKYIMEESIFCCCRPIKKKKLCYSKNAVLKIAKSSHGHKLINNEYKILSKLRHSPGIVSIIEPDFHNYFADKGFILTELCRRGDLFDYYIKSGKKISPMELDRIIYFIFRRVKSMHSAGIVHMDLKLENICLTGTGIYKIIDFGSAQIVDSFDPECLGLTKTYSPPDIFYKFIDKKHLYQIDIWEIGIIIYILIYRTYPVLSDEHYIIFNDKPINKGHKDLIKLLLDPNIDERPMLDEIDIKDYLL